MNTNDNKISEACETVDNTLNNLFKVLSDFRTAYESVKKDASLEELSSMEWKSRELRELGASLIDSVDMLEVAYFPVG